MHIGRRGSGAVSAEDRWKHPKLTYQPRSPSRRAERSRTTVRPYSLSRALSLYFSFFNNPYDNRNNPCWEYIYIYDNRDNRDGIYRHLALQEQMANLPQEHMDVERDWEENKLKPAQDELAQVQKERQVTPCSPFWIPLIILRTLTRYSHSW